MYLSNVTSWVCWVVNGRVSFWSLGVQLRWISLQGLASSHQVVYDTGKQSFNKET